MAAPRVRLEAPIDSVPFGKYLLRAQVATGRLSSVHRAVLRREGKPDERFAIKRFSPELSQDRRFVERATKVLSRAAQIKHPAHCKIVEVDRADDTLYAALEWVSGRDLKRIGVALRERGEMMPAALVAYIGGQIAEVLAEAHGLSRAGKPAPLLHGELSAVDILIGFDGRVRLTGLGSAELAVAAQVEAARTAYHAPEIGLGAACSEQTDVFALGACMLQVLSQKTALDSKSVARRSDSHITQIIPRALQHIVDRALAMQPAARWQTAAELAHQLQSWRSTQTQPADASSLSAFMRGLFDGVRDDEERTRPTALHPKRPEPVPPRDEPWTGVVEHTPANGVLMQQLAADMVGPAPSLPDSQSARATLDGSRSILEAIVNPVESELPPVLRSEPSVPAQAEAPVQAEAQAKPQSQPPVRAKAPQSRPPIQAQPQSQVASEGWDDEPWEAATSTSAWTSSTEERAPSVTPVTPHASSPVQAPAPLPAARPVVAPAAAQPSVRTQPSLVATPAMRDVAPAQASAPVMLETWQTERRAPWLVPSVIAGGAVGLVLIAVFVFGGDRSDSTSSSEKAAPSGAEPAPTVQQERAPSAATTPTDSLPTAPSPAPQAAAPNDPELGAEPESAPRRRADAPRAWESAPRDDRRERRQAPTEPEALRDDLEQAAAPAPPEPPAVVLPVVKDPVAKAPTWLKAEPTPVAVAPSPVAATKPAAAAPSAPSALRVPTRAAVVIDQVTPRFPARARRMDIAQGVVTIEFTIDKNGGVKDAVVVKAEPERVFEDAALKAIRVWKYQPKLVNGAPTESRQRFTFRFE